MHCPPHRVGRMPRDPTALSDSALESRCRVKRKPSGSVSKWTRCHWALHDSLAACRWSRSAALTISTRESTSRSNPCADGTGDVLRALCFRLFLAVEDSLPH